MQFFNLPFVVSIIFLLFVFVVPSTHAQSSQEESFFRLQKSGRPMMKAFLNRFPYHNPMFTLREEGGRQRPFSGF
ncbi:Neuropeptide-Like Protein [Caenorhabditis elegans]|uniref:Neuropeptide-Like Protein n=2 Tax=Caenorhabditis elegans TaxID=6239 RepID=A4UVK8_CAEEL|nr:Neuropeptide-Like Protein [Caenorhabditis elegans]CAM84820.1 Neuropeptide-Like Protein [Caenorhabditis elegans]|eukprot:NP_001256446.1 Uncharacterized protein CELE_R11D1.12 [Caenorhabditis elegans]